MTSVFLGFSSPVVSFSLTSSLLAFEKRMYPLVPRFFLGLSSSSEDGSSLTFLDFLGFLTSTSSSQTSSLGFLDLGSFFVLTSSLVSLRSKASCFSRVSTRSASIVIVIVDIVLVISSFCVEYITNK